MIRSLLDAGRIYRSSNGTRCMLTWQRVTRCRRRFAEAYAETAKTSATINTRAVGCLQDLCKQKALSVTGRLCFQHAVGNQRLVTQAVASLKQLPKLTKKNDWARGAIQKCHQQTDVRSHNSLVFLFARASHDATSWFTRNPPCGIS